MTSPTPEPVTFTGKLDDETYTVPSPDEFPDFDDFDSTKVLDLDTPS